MGTNKIMVVDDEELVLDVISRMLKKSNYEHQVFTSSNNALEKIIKNPYEFSIILTDLCMNDEMDGINLVSKVKYINKKIICIAMTGYNDKYPIDVCTVLGFKDILIKPISYDDLITVINYYIKFRERLLEYL